MYRILQETVLSNDRVSEAVGVMKELQQQSLDHLATKADLESLSARITEKLSLHQTSVPEKMNRHQSDLAEKMSRYHRNTIVWVVSTVATGITLAVGLFSLAIRYLP